MTKLSSPKDTSGPRTRDQVKAELRAGMVEVSRLADEMGDCGGLQGAAVLSNHPRLRRRLERLAAEAEALGITPEELAQEESK